MGKVIRALNDSDYRLVRNDRDLLEVVKENLLDIGEDAAEQLDGGRRARPGRVRGLLPGGS